MKNIIKYLLLDVINKNASVNRLIYEGLSYTEIIDLTNDLTREGLIQADESQLKLTVTGLEMLYCLEKEYKRTNKEQWIEKDLKNKIPQIDKKTIFLPRQDELTFIEEN